MLSAKVMPYLLRLAAPLLNSSIVQKTLESFKVSCIFHPTASQSTSAPHSAFMSKSIEVNALANFTTLVLNEVERTCHVF